MAQIFFLLCSFSVAWLWVSFGLFYLCLCLFCGWLLSLLFCVRLLRLFLALSSILVFWLCLELFFSFSFFPVSSVSLDGVFSVSPVLVVMAVRSIALFREDEGGDLPFCWLLY